MAIVFANLGASAAPDINDSTDLTSYASASWTPPTSGLILVFIQSSRTSGPDTPSVSGNSLTWTQIGTTLNAGSGRGLSLFAANASGSATGATTISFGANTQLACMASFLHATGVDLAGGVAAAFVQRVTNSALSNATSVTLTLAAAANSLNRPVSCFVHMVQEATTPRANWTEMDDLSGASYARGMNTQVREDAFETTASATWVTGAHWSAMAVELAASVASPTSSISLMIGLGINS